jgi:predicted nucleotidyltransferase
LRVFGSVARGEDRPDSDVDLLADFPPGLSLFGLSRLEAELESILGTRVDLIRAAEAVKALPDDLLATQPSIPWRQITRMRDHLAHRYFDTAHAILQATVGFAQISLLAGAGAGAEVTFDSAWSLRPGTDADRPTSLGR